ncbi:MAG: type IX secretion system membrane protein PorP/SprF [Cytophagales bacterium]|nr:type IX secretion system membrane protein PorP/SprF [Cytophagales bacterium]
MGKNFILLIFWLVSSAALGQVDPLYSQYLNNPFLINPAYTGMNKYFNIMVGYRNQWAGFDGSPTTVSVTAHLSLLNNVMGTGLIVSQDKVGEYRNTLVQGTYAYRINLQKHQLISFGLQAGIMNFRSDNTVLNPHDPGDPLFSGSQNITKPTFGAGVIIKGDRLFAGLSVPRLIKTKETFNNVGTELYSQHFYGFVSYVFHITSVVRFKPGVLIRGVSGSPLSTDVNLQFSIDERYTVGALTRNLNTFGFLAKFKFAHYRLGYVFELPTNNSVGTQFTTHDITFGINVAIFNFHDVLEVSDY